MDTSRGGAYHNKKYQSLAVEVGLTVERQKSNGWSQTAVPEETAKLYRAQIDELAGVLVAHRRTERDAIAAIGDSSDIDDSETTPNQDEPERAPRDGSSFDLRMHLAGPQDPRGQRTTDAGPILCGICGEVFVGDPEGGVARDR